MNPIAEEKKAERKGIENIASDSVKAVEAKALAVSKAISTDEQKIVAVSKSFWTKYGVEIVIGAVLVVGLIVWLMFK